ncbi:MAG: LuxR C-terminal-related transcriptional regulator [Bacteroidales bacterium]
MVTYLLIALFFISAALASGSILISIQLRKSGGERFFSTVLYLEVFLFMFGFYALWGQVIARVLLSPHISVELMKKVTDLTLLLGSPFIIFAWYMLLRLARELSGNSVSRLFSLSFLGINLGILLLLSFLPSRFPQWSLFILMKGYFCLAGFAYTACSAFILLQPGKGVPAPLHRRIIALALTGFILAQALLLMWYSGALWQSLLFILLFFAGSSFLPVYLRYAANLPKIEQSSLPGPSFDDFCRRFEISPRERDIIREICNGHSNQEIADKLFISLQTVKDHTHRIYSKVDIKSRVQLIKMIGEIE